MTKNENIDGGKAFDWGRTSCDYAKYRDIYPAEFYQYLLSHDIGSGNQTILDLGTGTGVLPRALYQYGATFTGVDISENQILQAKLLAQKENKKISFFSSPAEEIQFEEHSFDIVTACQCFFYFDHAALAPKINHILKENGRLVILYMAWLPFEDDIARQSENLILKYNPAWSGGGETRRLITIPEAYHEYFKIERNDIFDVSVPFHRESWNGRIKACRGIGASLPEEEIALFEQEHRALLAKIAPETFHILHFVAAAILRKK